MRQHASVMHIHTIVHDTRQCSWAATSSATEMCLARISSGQCRMCSPQSADLLIVTAATKFAEKHGARGRLAIASDDQGQSLLVFLLWQLCSKTSESHSHRKVLSSVWLSSPVSRAAMQSCRLVC